MQMRMYGQYTVMFLIVTSDFPKCMDPGFTALQSSLSIGTIFYGSVTEHATTVEETGLPPIHHFRIRDLVHKSCSLPSQQSLKKRTGTLGPPWLCKQC